MNTCTRIASLALGAVVGSAASASAQLDVQWIAFQNATATALEPGASGIASASSEVDLAWADLDKNGFVDLVVVRKQPFTTAGKRTNVLLMNETGVLKDRSLRYATASDVPGDLGFLTPTNDRDVAIADVDNDGWLDVITAPTTSDGDPKHIGHPRIYMNLGNDAQGAWQGLRFESARSPQITNVNGPQNPRFCSVAAGDLTGDGFPDLYFGDHDSSGSGGVGQPAGNDVNDRLWINDGHGFFSDESEFLVYGRMTDTMRLSSFAVAAVIGDFNLDGANDVIKDTALNPPTYVAAIYNDPMNKGYFQDFQPFSAYAPYHVSAGDLNRDGRLDVLLTDDATDRYRFNTGNDAQGLVAWSAAMMVSFATAGDDGFGGNSVVADLDLDGWNDALICDVDVEIPSTGNRYLHVYHSLGGTPGAFNIQLKHERETTGTSMSTGWRGVKGMVGNDLARTYDVAVFDVDNDGDPDMVLGNMQGLWVWSNELNPGPSFCQTSIGFAGPGNVTQSVCGGDLSTGNGAQMTVSGNQAAAPAVLFVSLSSTPVFVPELAGTLASFPVLFSLGTVTDGTGAIHLPVPGGSGPLSIYTQWIVHDPGQTAGFALSNAVRIDFKP